MKKASMVYIAPAYGDSVPVSQQAPMQPLVTTSLRKMRNSQSFVGSQSCIATLVDALGLCYPVLSQACRGHANQIVDETAEPTSVSI